ncbi:hypothetical protein B0J12DRAFT_350677 [Macrophomina phaseolina]|uniref:Uncharacterized protein n=1 Tax=Macrophomina phaseolina TaxID=35725 RepID=A0ABQ8FVQ3_9PEZI|nr:hypothetical protein B0J12DRAFT_350677 [Macrophomina phaseolina]
MARDHSQESFLLRDTRGSPGPPSSIKWQRKGLRNFLVSNPGMIVAMVFGSLCILGIFAFTFWLSKQLFWCPSWTWNCQVNDSVSQIAENLGLVQGIVAALYAVSLAGPVYTACALAEAAIWPILNKQAKTLKELDSFLSAARGSIASLFHAYRGARSIEAFVVVLCISTAILAPLAGSPLVGFAYTKQVVTTEYRGNFTVGAAMRNKYIQKNPPTRMPGVVEDAFKLYTSWSSQLADEPLPNFRDFIVNRAQLEPRGDVSVNAVRVQKLVNCIGHAVNLTDKDHVSVTTDTHMTGNSSNTTLLRIQPELTVWVDHIRYLSETRTISTLIFAAINGSIENGQLSQPTDIMRTNNYTGLEAVACDIDVTLADSSFQTGSGTGAFANVSALNMLEGPTYPASPYGALGDLAAWFGVAPAVMGISIHGAQPMFEDLDPLPGGYATYRGPKAHHWELATLHRFINVSSGALATSMHLAKNTDQPTDRPLSTLLVSRKPVRRLASARAYYLLAPLFVVLAAIAVLVGWNCWLHRRANVPIMRLAHVSEVIKSAQTADVLEPAGEDSKYPSEPSTLKDLRVRFGMTSGGVLGFGRTVSPL